MAQWCSCPLPMRSRTRSTPSAETSSSTCCCSSILPERRLRTPGPPQGSLTRHITPSNIRTTIKGALGREYSWQLHLAGEEAPHTGAAPGVAYQTHHPFKYSDNNLRDTRTRILPATPSCRTGGSAHRGRPRGRLPGTSLLQI
jgi:hypothetical protein